MGYTNYIEKVLPFTDEQWSQFTKACKHLQEIAEYNHPNTLEWFFEDDTIGFNADGIETAFIERNGMDWDFCKTNRQEPDIWVKTLYTLARFIVGAKVSCNGRMDEYGRKYYDIAKYCVKKAINQTAEEAL